MAEREKKSAAAHAIVLFILFALCLFSVACSPDSLSDSPVGPGGDTAPIDEAGTASVMDIALRLAIRPGKTLSGPALAVARDDTTSDSTNLYIDVEITNLGPEVLYQSAQAKNLVLRVLVTFADFPWRKNFERGRLDIVVGQTETGYQATEKVEFGFLADSILTFEIPISRIDSFQVADNVAVYGTVLAADRYIIARRVRVFDSPSIPAGFAAPDFVGFVRSVDSRARRLTVSGATVVITDSTEVLSPSGEFLGLEMLNTGSNRLTVTALAWGYDLLGNMIANGWEFRHYDLCVARPITP